MMPNFAQSLSCKRGRGAGGKAWTLKRVWGPCLCRAVARIPASAPHLDCPRPESIEQPPGPAASGGILGIGRWEEGSSLR